MFEADAATPSFETLYAELRRMALMPYRVDGPSRMLAQVTSALTNNLMQARPDAGRRAAESALPAIHALLARGCTRADDAAAPPHSRTREIARAD